MIRLSYCALRLSFKERLNTVERTWTAYAPVSVESTETGACVRCSCFVQKSNYIPVNIPRFNHNGKARANSIFSITSRRTYDSYSLVEGHKPCRPDLLQTAPVQSCCGIHIKFKRFALFSTPLQIISRSPCGFNRTTVFRRCGTENTSPGQKITLLIDRNNCRWRL